MEQALSLYLEQNKKIRAMNFASYLIQWDTETEMPRLASASRAKHMGILSEMSYRLSSDPEYTAAIETLYQNKEKLDPVLAHEITVMRQNNEKLRKTPVEEYVAYATLLNTLSPIYVEAKRSADFSLVRPYYEQIFAFQRKYVAWQKTDRLEGYDVLLDEYEPGMTRKEYDVFFAALKESLVPFIKQIQKKKLSIPRVLTHGKFPVEKQKEFCEYLRRVMCFDPNHTVVKESEHPFTTGSGTSDVRITNHYYEDNLASCIFSAIHEMGHGLYEMQVDPALDDTMSGGGASMALHESQSRLMENMVGRSREFWQVHFPRLKKTFPKKLANVTLDDFLHYINHVECSLIRTEADELTYPLHIMIRYELEQALLDGTLEVKDLPAAWNRKYKEYLGIDVPSDREGVLQDVHWSCGNIGYFPTYALGSAYAAQIMHAMLRDLDLEKALADGDISPLASWLKDHLHKYGASKTPKELIRLATGEDFSPHYYIDYLIEKYSRIYGIDA